MSMSLMKWSLLIVSALSLAACGAKQATTGHEAKEAAVQQEAGTAAGQAAPARAAQQQAEAVEALLRARYGNLGGEMRYFAGDFDLDGDGRAETVVYAYGPMLCGTGGCDTLVLTPAEQGYRLVTAISVSRPPIRVSPRSSNGWRNLIVHVSGGGIEKAYEAELKFDGASYPENPTVAPAEPAQGIEGAETLIAAFGEFTDGKPVPPQ